ILMLPERRITPVVLIDDERTRATIKSFPPLPVIHSRFLNVRSRWGRVSRMAYTVFRRDLLMEGLLRWHRIAALSHSHRPGLSTAVPAIAWIPDFQHVHLPEFFSAK